LRSSPFHSTLPRMATQAREALLVLLPVAEAEEALDDVLSERGFERANRLPPRRTGTIARSDARFFALDELQPTLTLVREWTGYKDATTWGAALELAEGLPPAARMEMALPPALSVLARAISRRATVLGFATRDDPWHLVGVAFRGGKAIDVITAIKDRVVIGPGAKPRESTPQRARIHVDQWLAPYSVDSAAIEIVFGDRDLPASWRIAYVLGS
jgi:hypothetical protein